MLAAIAAIPVSHSTHLLLLSIDVVASQASDMERTDLEVSHARWRAKVQLARRIRTAQRLVDSCPLHLRERRDEFQVEATAARVAYARAKQELRFYSWYVHKRLKNVFIPELLAERRGPCCGCQGAGTLCREGHERRGDSWRERERGASAA